MYGVAPTAVAFQLCPASPQIFFRIFRLKMVLEELLGAVQHQQRGARLELLRHRDGARWDLFFRASPPWQRGVLS